MYYLLTGVVCLVTGYVFAMHMIDGYVRQIEKKSKPKPKCKKCKSKPPMEGSDLCYYCEIVEFRQSLKKKIELAKIEAAKKY